MAFARSQDHLDGDELAAEALFVPHPERSMLMEAPDGWGWADIREGDWLVIERGRRPANGDLLLLNVAGGHQLGQVMLRRGELRLTHISRPRADIDIQAIGVVTRFLRVFSREL
jgi:hypothetical protein